MEQLGTVPDHGHFMVLVFMTRMGIWHTVVCFCVTCTARMPDFLSLKFVLYHIQLEIKHDQQLLWDLCFSCFVVLFFGKKMKCKHWSVVCARYWSLEFILLFGFWFCRFFVWLIFWSCDFIVSVFLFFVLFSCYSISCVLVIWRFFENFFVSGGNVYPFYLTFCMCSCLKYF